MRGKDVPCGGGGLFIMLNNNMYFTGLEIFVYTIVIILGRNGGQNFNSILQRDTIQGGVKI